MTDVFDFIIIGGGIAGLYSAYLIKKNCKNARFIILEANQAVGGRMGDVDFEGKSVVTGAGIGRKRKDKILRELLEELRVPYHEYQSSHNYSDDLNCNVKDVFQSLKDRHPLYSIGKTFKEFALTCMSPTQYELFVTCAGYTDYEKEDSYDTFYHYGFSDNYSNFIGLSIPWKKLLTALVKKIGGKNIATSTQVEEIEMVSEIYHIKTSKKTFCSHKIILATTIESLRHLLPYPIYKQICGQPFLRVYGKCSFGDIDIMKKVVNRYTIVQGPLQKMIPIEPDNGIYMIAYSDNECAKTLRPYLKNNKKNRTYFEGLIKDALNVDIHLLSIMSVYWDIGTHYYRPLRKFDRREDFIKKAQRPEKNIRVVGEMVSLSQGWVEGALVSVKKVMKKGWMNCIFTKRSVFTQT